MLTYSLTHIRVQIRQDYWLLLTQYLQGSQRGNDVVIREVTHPSIACVFTLTSANVLVSKGRRYFAGARERVCSHCCRVYCGWNSTTSYHLIGLTISCDVFITVDSSHGSFVHNQEFFQDISTYDCYLWCDYYEENAAWQPQYNEVEILYCGWVTIIWLS